MKIATWNVERPSKTSSRIPKIEEQLKLLDADIIILTETNACINPGAHYRFFHTEEITTSPDIDYKPGERRVSIYSKYDVLGQIETFNNETAICVRLNTPLGVLAVYGTIIGVFGNREESFKTDLGYHVKDFQNKAARHKLCIASDFNMSFSDNYYHTNEGRDKLNETFKSAGLVNLTAKIKDNIDHIVLSKSIIGDKEIQPFIWNCPVDKKLSDHMGVVVTII